MHGHDPSALLRPGDIPRRSTPSTSRASNNPNRFPDKPLDLAIATIKNFHAVEPWRFSESQEAAIQQLKEWFKGNDILSCGVESISQCILLLSKAFFLKDIEPNMVTIARTLFDLDKDGSPLCFGSSHHIDDGMVFIQIDPRDWHKLKGVKDHRTAQFSALFHECIHAYFQLFCCDSKMHGIIGCSNRGESVWIPGTRHDVAWFHLAAALELALESHFACETDLSVFRSLLKEYETNGARTCSSGEWRQFFEFYFWGDFDGMLSKLNEEEYSLLLWHLSDPKSREVITVFNEEYVDVMKRWKPGRRLSRCCD